MSLPFRMLDCVSYEFCATKIYTESGNWKRLGKEGVKRKLPDIDLES